MKIFLFTYLLITCTVYTQDKVDSLVNAIQYKSTLEKIKTLDDFCWKNRDFLPQQALRAGNMALMLAESIDNKHYISKTLNFLSVIYRDQGEYERSLKYANRGLDVATQANDETEIAYSYNNISTIYRLMGNYVEAIEKLYDALKIFENINDSTGIAYCYYNLGLVFLKKDNYEKALESFKKTYLIREKINDQTGKIKALGRTAEVYLKIGNVKKAFEIFKIVEENYNSVSDKRNLMVAIMGLANIYKRKNELDSAISKRESALSLAKDFNDVNGIVSNLSELGNLYTVKKNLTKAKQYLDEAFKVAENFNSSDLKTTVYKNLVDYYQLAGDFKNAFKYLKILKIQQDSNYLKEKRTAISEVESAYLISKKERENILLTHNLEQEKAIIKYYLLISILLIGLVFTLFYLYRYNKKTAEQLKELNATKDKFFSIIAHDLKNPITSQFGLSSILIHEFNEMSDEEKLQIIKSIDNAGKQTYKLLENLLYWARSQTGKLDFNPKEFDLNEIVLDTISLFNESAKAKNIKIEFHERPYCIVYADEEMIKTVLRNLISNAIKFTKDNGIVKISLNEYENKKLVAVQDNGIGIENNILEKIFRVDSIASSRGTHGEKGTGLGLVLCKEFVEKNNGKIWVESEIDKGSTFYFTIPTL